MSEPERASSSRRWPKVLGISLALSLIVVVIAFQVAVRVLKREIVAALGPDAGIRELNVGLTHVEIIGIRLPASSANGKGAWPADDFLRAERLVITPSLSSLFGERIVLKNLRVEGAYLSILRERGGRLRLIPTLTENAAPAKAVRRSDPARFSALRRAYPMPCVTAVGPRIDIERVEIMGSRLDFFDASIRKTPLRITLENLDFSLDHLRLPELTGESRMKLAGVLKGRAQDGKVRIEGEIEFASKDSDLHARFQGVDLTVLQAYLVKTNEVSIQRGILDMEVRSVVKKGQLHGPGTLALSHLRLGSGNAFMGVPRNLVIAALKGGKDRIDIKFTLSGNIDNPGFSMNESIAREIGVGLMNALGLNVENLARNLGNAGGDIGKLGDSLGKMLGRQ
ncbi:MAG: DUF748 domain-containing protein [Zoogloeaceae bacterium]|jgi:hypothetical protein|nr:DUF748 domain-containing protein [Zoogloeaceae bacterium]